MTLIPTDPAHVELNTVVFDELRLAYVPVPKAASTSILGALFELAGGGLDDRMRSLKHEATRDQTVHDASLWDPRHRLEQRSATEREWILESDEWFRFTVVREPARRIWSAWVSKVLVRDPRFVLMFGEDWFPAVPSSAIDVVTSFRAFVSGLPNQPDWADPHWSAQHELAGISRIEYDHVGRLESLDQTEAVLSHYIAQRGGTLPALGTKNGSLLPFSPGLFDRPTRNACLRLTADDRRALGYEPVQDADGEPDEPWLRAVEASLPALRALIERHKRLLDLWLSKADTDRESHWQRDVAVVSAIAAAASVATVLAARQGNGHNGSRWARHLRLSW